MLETPILFTDELVRCIVDGLKTETRRYGGSVGRLDVCEDDWLPDDTPLRVGLVQTRRGYGWTDSAGIFHRSPYGKPGDMLWVREGYATTKPMDAKGKRKGTTWPSRSTETGRSDWLKKYGVYTAEVNYRARLESDLKSGKLLRMNKMFMPRWASRVDLRILSARFDRLELIDDAGAIAEGFESRRAFEDYWVKLYGAPAGFPYVWVYSFRLDRLKPVRVGGRWVNEFYERYIK